LAATGTYACTGLKPADAPYRGRAGLPVLVAAPQLPRFAEPEEETPWAR